MQCRGAALSLMSKTATYCLVMTSAASVRSFPRCAFSLYGANYVYYTSSLERLAKSDPCLWKPAYHAEVFWIVPLVLATASAEFRVEGESVCAYSRFAQNPKPGNIKSGRSRTLIFML